MTEQVGLTQLVGSWRLVSLGMTYEDTKERIEHYGPHPTGYMVLSPNGRIIFLFTRADRTAPQTDADRATLFSAMTAYTGRVRIEAEDRFVITVDLAWDPGWTGEQNSIFHPGAGPAEDPDTGTDASANGRPAVRRRFGVGARDVISTKVLVAYLRIALVVFCVHFPIGRKTKLWRSVRDRSLARNGTVVLRPRPLLSGLPKIQTETLPRRCPNECRIHSRGSSPIRRRGTDRRHCTDAGLLEKAASLWGKAEQRSLERSALVEAVALFTRALDQVAA